MKKIIFDFRLSCIYVISVTLTVFFFSFNYNKIQDVLISILGILAINYFLRSIGEILSLDNKIHKLMRKSPAALFSIQILSKLGVVFSFVLMLITVLLIYGYIADGSYFELIFPEKVFLLNSITFGPSLYVGLFNLRQKLKSI